MGLGYKQSQGDHTLFFKHSQEGKLAILLVYVDDIIVTGNDLVERQLLKERLVTEFEMKDLGKLNYFLGIEVAYSEQGISFLKGSMFLIFYRRQTNLDVNLQVCLLSKITKCELKRKVPRLTRSNIRD